MNASRSSIFSPVPMNFMGAPVAATADSAPPPREEPSSLVTMIAPIGVASWKVLAWAKSLLTYGAVNNHYDLVRMNVLFKVFHFLD